MTSVTALLSGKKTYIIGTIIFVIGGLQALGIKIPADVLTLLGSLGLMTLRAAVEKTP